MQGRTAIRVAGISSAAGLWIRPGLILVDGVVLDAPSIRRCSIDRAVLSKIG
jgi:hypothetical protein